MVVINLKGKFDLKTGRLVEPYLMYQTCSELIPKRKPVKTMGHPLKSFADLAVLTRARTKPVYAKLRYLDVKDDVTVEYECVI